MLRHFLAALAYRTQKAVRDAPPSYASFEAGNRVRTPHDIVKHMDSVLGYARTFFIGGEYRATRAGDFETQLRWFHDMLQSLSSHLQQGTPLKGTTAERLLQGPFADAMTHAGQLAMLRRLAGSPVRPENFIYADVDKENVGPDQSQPVSPDAEWPEGDF